ncbi:DUF3800 domain-containing protein [Candidatus Pyrohabitans sp.]
MLYIFLDEAGDLGFSDRASRYFVIAALTVANPVSIRRMFKRIRQRKLKKRVKQLQEFKFSRSDDFIKMLILRRLIKQEIEINYVVLKKSRTVQLVQDRQNILYNHLSGVLIDRLTSYREREFKIVVDRLFSKSNREEFNRYLQKRVFNNFYSEGRLKPKIEIEHSDSTSEPCLQAVDFVVGAVFSKYERHNDQYYKIIEEKVNKKLEEW